MLGKIKITGTKFIDYSGMSILKVPEGTIVQCIKGGTGNSNAGDILVRTRFTDKPFQHLVDGGGRKSQRKERGEFWGSDIGNYKFRVLKDKTINDYPE